MENIRRILFSVLLTTVLQIITGQVLSTEQLFQHYYCFGSHGTYSIVNASCSADQVIAVSSARAGGKLNNSSCPDEVNATTNVDFGNCCKITANDCVVNVSMTIWHSYCSGKMACTIVQAIREQLNCGSTYRSFTSNMELNYYCINGTKINPTCAKATMTTAGGALYLWNTGYPLGPNTDTKCVCSIEVDSCSAHIKVTAMRIDLLDENGTCIQNITFSRSYGNPEMVIDCSKKYDITSLFTSTTNYISMNFISARNNTEGKYWIRFEATDAASNLQVNCNPDVQQMFCTTTTTTTPSTTSTTTTPTTTTKTTSTTNPTKTPGATSTTTTTTTSTTTTAKHPTNATTTTSATSTTIASTATTGTTSTTTTTSATTTTISTKISAMYTTTPASTTGSNATNGKNEEGSQNRLEFIAFIVLLVPVAIIIACIVRKRCPVQADLEHGQKEKVEKNVGDKGGAGPDRTSLPTSPGSSSNVPPHSTSVREMTQVEIMTGHQGARKVKDNHEKNKKRKKKKEFPETNQGIDNKTTADSERHEVDSNNCVIYVRQPMQDKTQKKSKTKKKKKTNEFDYGNRDIDDTLVGAEEREGMAVGGDSLSTQTLQTETHKKRKNKKNRKEVDPDSKGLEISPAMDQQPQEYKVEGEFDNKNDNLAISSQLKEYQSHREKKKKRSKHKKRTEDVIDNYNMLDKDEFHPSRSRVFQDTNAVQYAETEERKHKRKKRRKHKRHEYSDGGEEDPCYLDKS